MHRKKAQVCLLEKQKNGLLSKIPFACDIYYNEKYYKNLLEYFLNIFYTYTF